MGKQEVQAGCVPDTYVLLWSGYEEENCAQIGFAITFPLLSGLAWGRRRRKLALMLLFCGYIKDLLPELS